MNPISFATFDQAVAQYFEPLARDNQWPLVRISKEVFEIQSPFFVMQIRFGVGMHSRNIDAVLVPVSQKQETESDGGAFGILAIAGYNGIEMEIAPREQTELGFFEYALYLAKYAQRFGLPYMLGQKLDSGKIKEYWWNKSEMDLKKIKGHMRNISL
jgi:hypothetical protein